MEGVQAQTDPEAALGGGRPGRPRGGTSHPRGRLHLRESCSFILPTLNLVIISMHETL